MVDLDGCWIWFPFHGFEGRLDLLISLICILGSTMGGRGILIYLISFLGWFYRRHLILFLLDARRLGLSISG